MKRETFATALREIHITLAGFTVDGEWTNNERRRESEQIGHACFRLRELVRELERERREEREW